MREGRKEGRKEGSKEGGREGWREKQLQLFQQLESTCSSGDETDTSIVSAVLARLHLGLWGSLFGLANRVLYKFRKNEKCGLRFQAVCRSISIGNFKNRVSQSFAVVFCFVLDLGCVWHRL